MVQQGAHEPLGHGPGGRGDAERGRCRGGPARRASGRGARDDVHRVPGPAVDDPEHVQDRRRADLGGGARGRAVARGAGAVDLRRPLGCDGGPSDRLCIAGRGVGAGGARPRARGACRNARDPRPVRALLRRLSHLARAADDRDARGRGRARADLGRARSGASRAGAVAGAAVHPRHRAEPRHLLPGARERQPVLRARPRDRAGRDGPTGGADRPPLPAGGLQRPPGSRAGRGRDGVRRRDRARDGRLPASAGRTGWRGAAQALPALPRGRAGASATPERAAGRRAGPDQGAGLSRRAAVPGRARGIERSARHRGARGDADGDRRSLRPVLEGVHTGNGRRRVRGART